jgi:small-conductance mechanosensitive channel
MYEWVLFVHVASVLAFMLAHGIHVTVMWAMRREADPERSMTFFNALPTATGLRIVLVVVVVTGTIAAFMGSWWGSGWIWASLLLLTVIAVGMWRFGGAYFGLVENAATAAIAARNTDPTNPAPQAAFDMARRSWHTIGMSVLGLGGIAVILWLMMFKPF